MDRCYEIGKVNLKTNLFPHLLLAVVFCLASQIFLGFTGLESLQIAQMLETYVALIGIIILIPVFHPDQNKDIRDLTDSRATSMTLVHVVRFAEAMLFLMLLLWGIIMILKNYNDTFPAVNYYFGTVAEAFFLGAIGLLAYSLTDQMVMGYMIPIMYYVVNFGAGDELGNFKLFSMMYGSYESKIWLTAAGILCAAAAFAFRRRR